jgi:8-oxo-dGTP pyrophosphatase MutT (NUDIX family)
MGTPDRSVRDVAAAVILNAAGETLIVQRGPTAPTYPDHWGVITGFVDPGETPEQAALREIAEELGVTAHIQRSGEAFLVDAGHFVARIWPFLCAIDRPDEIQLHPENQRYEWVPIASVFTRPTLPRLDQDFRALGLIP